MYPFLMYDFDFNVQPRLNIVEEEQPVLTSSWKIDNETEIVKHVASVDFYTKDEGWVEYPVYMQYEDDALGCIESARWYHTKKGPYIILEYEYGQRWFGQDGTTADVRGSLSEVGFRCPEHKDANDWNSENSRTGNERHIQRNTMSNDNTYKRPNVMPFLENDSDIDFRLSPKVRINHSFINSYEAFVYLKGGEEKKIEWTVNGGFDLTLGAFSFAQWEIIGNNKRYINIVFEKGTVRLGCNNEFEELDFPVKDNRTMESFLSDVYELSVPPTFSLTRKNNEEWYKVKVLSKHKDELITICHAKTPDNDHLKAVYWYEFDDDDTYIVLEFENGNKWLAANGCTAKIDPPADKGSIRQNYWSVEYDINDMSTKYKEEEEPFIDGDTDILYVASQSPLEGYVPILYMASLFELKSASWHRYNEGVYLIKIFSDKIYISGLDANGEIKDFVMSRGVVF